MSRRHLMRPKLAAAHAALRAGRDLVGWCLRGDARGRRSLVTRLSLLLLLGTVIIYVIGILGLWWTSVRLIEDGLKKQALQWIAEMEEFGSPLYGTAKVESAYIENRIKNFPEIAFVRYYDAAGTTILREYGKQAQSVPLLTAGELTTLRRVATKDRAYVFDRSVPVGGTANGIHYVRVIAPIRTRYIANDGLFNFDLHSNGGESTRVLGYIDLGIDPNLQRDSLAKSLAFGGMLTAIIFIFALAVGRELIKKALHPLTDLQTPLARLARGEIDVAVATHGDAEIVAIGDALNATVSALKQRDAALRELAERDALTGLFNRNRFTELLTAEIARVKDCGGSSALLFIDLDRFKYVNDTLGHAEGDKLLMQVAQLIKTRMREADIVARFGGDEFTVLASGVTRAGALEVTKLIMEIMRNFYFISREQTFNVCCSIGIALITPHCTGAAEAMLHADTACYEAKKRGRNRFHLYEKGEHEIQSTIKDLGWAEQIKHALKDNRFRLVYQPIVSIGGPEHEYYEVLLRMPDARGHSVSPAAFLSVAERFGLMADIDRWILTHALEALARFRADGRDVTFSINLSGQSFEDPAIVHLIKDRLRVLQIPPEAVVFEITEQIAVRYMDKARRLMQSLIDTGCRFSLDDFGVGFSSFGYLKHFPVSYIKIDGSFVENMASEPVDQAMVRAIAQIAKALGKQVIAEFVQDEASVALLKRYKVDYIQGYHVGMPSVTVPHRCFAHLATKPAAKRIAV